MPRGVNPPSSHARVSAFVPGPVPRPSRLRPIRESGEGHWARLSPEERALLQAAAKEGEGGRYAEQSADYAASLSQDEE